MNVEQYEHTAALGMVRFAMSQAAYYANDSLKEAAVAILIHALELATPELSPERRASLFTQGE